jgi:cell division protein FtsN
MFKKKGVFPKAKSDVPEESTEDLTLQEGPEAPPSEKEAEAPEDENFLPFAEEEDFFKEPDFNESNESPVVEEASERTPVSDLPDLSEDIDLGSDEEAEESGMDESFDSDFEEDMEEKPAKNKKTLLLVLLLVIIGGYAAYTFVLPQFSSDTASQKQTVTAKKVTQRIPIKKPQPAKPEATKKAAKVAPTVATTPKSTQPEKTAAAPAPKEVKSEEVKKVAAKATMAPPAKPAVATASINPEEIRVIKSALPATAEKGYFVQSGAFIFKNNLNSPRKKIEALGYTTKIEMGSKVVKMNRLTVGEWDNESGAKSSYDKLKREGYDAKIINVGKSLHAILIGSYYYGNVANEERIILEAKGYDAKIVRTPIKMKVYHLLVGPYETSGEAAQVEAALGSEGIKSAILQSP